MSYIPHTAFPGQRSSPEKRAFRSFFIGGIEIDPPLVLAPMAGVTNHAFRVRCKRAGGCGLVSTEMFSAYAIKFRNPGTKEMIDWTDEERPVCAQVFGADPETIAVAAKALEKAGADIIDLNFGCPVPKVAKSGSGAALLKDLGLAREILIAARDAVQVPLTIKTRIGWEPGHLVVLELAKTAEICGVDAISVHARYATQDYGKPVSWDIIAQVKQAVRIPVIANGDISTPQQASEVMDLTGCDGVMIGRGALGDPWIFRRVWHYLRTGDLLPGPTWGQRLDAATEHAVALAKLVGEERAAKEMRGHVVWYLKGMPGAPKLRHLIMKTASLKDMIRVLNEARGQCEPGIVKTKQDV